MTKRKPLRLMDSGTPELRQHHQVVLEGDRQSRMGGANEPHMRVVDQRPLDRYFVRGLLAPKDEKLNDKLFRAGEKLRQQWDLAGLAPRITARLDGMPGDRKNIVEGQIGAAEKKTAALREVGPTLTPVLVHVVCCDGSAGEWAVRHGWDERLGLGALRLALDALARHYRM